MVKRTILEGIVGFFVFFVFPFFFWGCLAVIEVEGHAAYSYERNSLMNKFHSPMHVCCPYTDREDVMGT